MFRYICSGLILLSLISPVMAQPSTSESPSRPGGLNPLRPPEGARISRNLRTAPEENASLIRYLQKTDRLSILRNQGEWFELQVTTAEGLEFIGWAKSKLPQELEPPPAPPKAEATSEPSLKPIVSENYRWFWSRRLNEVWDFSIGGGFQNIAYLQTGIFESTGFRGEVYDFNLNGISLGFDTELTILETDVFERELEWSLWTKYIFSFYQVKLSNNFPIAELQGAGYSIINNFIHVAMSSKMSLLDFSEDRDFRGGLGVGYLYYEFRPDLKAIDGGEFDGKFVFTDFNFYGITTPVIFEARPLESFGARLRFSPIFLAQMGEKPANTSGDDLSVSGFPWFADLNATYFWNPNWGANLDISYLFLDGKNTGEANRIATEAFSDARLQFRNLSINLGLRGSF